MNEADVAYATSVFIAAAPDRVFDHLVKSDLLVRWMGERAANIPVPGGTYLVDINGVLIRGQFLQMDRPRRLVISWGELGNAALPPGSSRVTFTLEPEQDGTRIHLVHEGLGTEEQAKHAAGWPHFLARLAVAAPGGDPGPDPFAPPGGPAGGGQAGT